MLLSTNSSSRFRFTLHVALIADQYLPLYSKRALEDLTEDELDALTAFLQSADISKREPLGSVGKGAIGLVASLGASELAGGLLDKIESLFKREMSLDELD